MDQSFNDEELSDIMKEIEALEEDLTKEHINAESSTDVIEELAAMPEAKAIPLKKHDAHVAKPAAGSTRMSFKVEGDLQLQLQFEVGEKVVALSVSEKGLTIEMEGGVCFTVPVAGKKAA